MYIALKIHTHITNYPHHFKIKNLMTVAPSPTMNCRMLQFHRTIRFIRKVWTEMVKWFSWPCSITKCSFFVHIFSLSTENQSKNTWVETPSLIQLVLTVLHCTDGNMFLLTLSKPSSVNHTEHVPTFDIDTSSAHMEWDLSSATILHNNTEHLKKYRFYTNITNASCSQSSGSY
jgi:hypothetical protein